MRRNSIFLFFVVILCMAQFVSAQSYTIPYREEGVASWYGEEFNGRPTASGELFDSNRFTAAHPVLSFGTFLIVTNKLNNRQVTVTVNDRGPFIPGRILDLSKAAAQHLDMLDAGTVPVIIETMPATYLRPPEPPAPPPQALQPMVEPLPPAAIYAPEPAPSFSYPPISVTVYPPPQAQAPEPVNPYPAPNPFPASQMVAPLESLAPQQSYSPGSYSETTSLPPPQAVSSYEEPLPPLQPQLPQPALTAAPSYEALPPSSSGITLTPAILPLPGSLYKLQIGSYKVPRNAVEAFDKLKGAGLNPAYELNGEFYRVVLAGIRGTDVQSVTEKLERAGFREAVIKEDK